MSAILTCTPDDAPLSATLVLGESAACGSSVSLPVSVCEILQASDLSYRTIGWAEIYPWQSRDIFWDSGLADGFTCQIDDWASYTMVPSDRWENIQDFWSSLGTY